MNCLIMTICAECGVAMRTWPSPSPCSRGVSHQQPKANQGRRLKVPTLKISTSKDTPLTPISAASRKLLVSSVIYVFQNCPFQRSPMSIRVSKDVPLTPLIPSGCHVTQQIWRTSVRQPGAPSKSGRVKEWCCCVDRRSTPEVSAALCGSLSALRKQVLMHK